MESKPRLPILDRQEPSDNGMNRRQLIQRLVAGAGAGVALPGLAAAHPIRKHLMNSMTMDAADAQTAAAEWTPLFLDPHQNETLIVLGERIIPGSSKAQVNRFIDLLLSVESADDQKKFINSLSAFEAESLTQYGSPFKDLTEAQQVELLTKASAPKGGQEAGGGFRRRVALGHGASSSGTERVTIHDHFDNLKGWVMGAYYTSEIGMKELGWTGQVFFESFPGCQHPGGHH